MVSKSKLYAQLDALELELIEKLVPHLEQAANGHNDRVFCVKPFSPFPESKYQSNQTTEMLVTLGAQILALKTKVGEPSDGSIAQRICWYCRQWGKLETSHKKSAQGLAKEFLQEIKAQLHKK